MIKVYLFIAVLFVSFFGNTQEPTAMKKIKRGAFVPLYGSDSLGVYVRSFKLDTYPVTNKQYLEFVKSNKKWRKSTNFWNR